MRITLLGSFCLAQMVPFAKIPGSLVRYTEGLPVTPVQSACVASIEIRGFSGCMKITSHEFPFQYLAFCSNWKSYCLLFILKLVLGTDSDLFDTKVNQESHKEDRQYFHGDGPEMCSKFDSSRPWYIEKSWMVLWSPKKDPEWKWIFVKSFSFAEEA